MTHGAALTGTLFMAPVGYLHQEAVGHMSSIVALQQLSNMCLFWVVATAHPVQHCFFPLCLCFMMLLLSQDCQ